MTEDVVIDGLGEPTHRGEWTLSVVSARARGLVGQALLVPWTGCEVGRQPQGVRPPLALDDPTLSRSHALLDPLGLGRGVQVHDCGSRNGVYVNGTKVQAAELSHRSLVRMGHVLAVLSCGAPPADWRGTRADLPALADTLAPRGERGRWIDAIDALGWEKLLLHPWRSDDEVRQVFQELLGYAQISEQAVSTMLSARVKAAEASRQWGLRRPSRDELDRLLALCNGRVAEVAQRLGVDRRQVYRWVDYYRRDGADDDGAEP